MGWMTTPEQQAVIDQIKDHIRTEEIQCAAIGVTFTPVNAVSVLFFDDQPLVDLSRFATDEVPVVTEQIGHPTF